MPLKYVGPKVLISKTGIDFDNNKEDKYVYLHIALQILKAIDHEYIEERVYTYTADTQRLRDDELYQVAKEYCKGVDDVMESARQSAEDYVDDLLTRAKENRLLNGTERETLIKNISLMHKYIVQRSVNKHVYYCIINRLATLLRKDNIDYIIAPMFQKFAHVFHSIQGALIHQKSPINSTMEIYEEKGKLLVKLDVMNVMP